MTNENSEQGRLLSGRYRLAELIGEGGMGRVWEGVDELLDRPVAIKELTISPQLPAAEVEVLRTRMLREARSAAQLSHPSIITVFDVVEIDERPWIVMELVRGPSLGDLVRQERMDPARAAKIGVQVAGALAVAHEHGIVHRDIKPGNVLIARGDRAVLTDFGIAHLEGSTHLTSTGLLVGSPSYLAPEQAHGYPAKPASDIWALGVTLYQAVEGSTPFSRSTPMATLTAIVTADVPQPKAAGVLAPALERLLQKDAQDRPSVNEAVALLQEAAEGTQQQDAQQREPSTTAVQQPPARSGPPAATVSGPAASGGAGATGPTGSAGPPQPMGPTGSAAPAPPANQYTGAAYAGGGTMPPGPGTGTSMGAAAGGGRRSNTPLAVLGGLVALVLVAGLVMWLGSQNGMSDQGGTAGASSDMTADPSPEESAAADGGAAEGQGGQNGQNGQGAQDGQQDMGDAGGDGNGEQPEPDPDMTDYEDPNTGFTVDIPQNWTFDHHDGRSVIFDIPDEGYLQIDQTPNPQDNALADWERQEPKLSANFPEYELVEIRALGEPYTDDYVSAADWEFTFRGSGGARMHAIDRAFHTEETGYALFLVTTEQNFARNSAILDEVGESFDPGE
ncbi:serine/threonine-protein kinase [Streptomonospora sediminis]